MIKGEPPKPILWWTATHQFHTFSCSGPATTANSRPSFCVQTMYCRPSVTLQYTRPAA